MTLKAIFYGRYSHEDSTDKSIEDQRAAAERYAATIGAEITAAYTDYAISGVSLFIRPGVLSLLNDLDQLGADLLLVDYPDRLTRDESDMGSVFKALTFLGMEFHAVSHGKLDRNTAAILAVVSRSQLDATAHAVRRGQHGVVRSGRSAGGRPYGYALAQKRGEIVPDEGDDLRIGEAEVVRRIYRERLEGLSPRDIAAGLNRDNIPAPRGKKWNASTLNGSRNRRYGILRNSIYMGVREWNRVTMVRHPNTGKRISRVNPEKDFVRIEMPGLAIVSKETFEAVQKLFPPDRDVRPEKFRRAKTILTGLLKCGCCGGGMSMKDRSAGRIRVQCTTMKESRSCSNTSAFYLDELVDAAVGGLHRQLSEPRLLSEVVKSFNAEQARLAGDTAEKTRILEKKLSALRSRERKVWEDYDAGLFGAEIANPRLAELQSQVCEVEREIELLPSMPRNVSLHPASIKEFAGHVGRLLGSFDVQITDQNREAAEAIRRLIERVIVTPTETGTDVRIFGTIGLLIQAVGSGASRGLSMLGGTMVAEEGLEPPTRGL